MPTGPEPWLTELIAHYGYAAVVVGTFLEGETILVVAGMAAHQGHLSLPIVIACAFVGSLSGDQLWFWVGRHLAARVLERRPKLRRRVAEVHATLAHRQMLFVLGFRFVYGLRSVAPFAFGMTPMSAGHFLIANAVGAALWSISFGGAGWLFGHALEALLMAFARSERRILLLLLLVGAVTVLVRSWRSRRDGHRPLDPPAPELPARRGDQPGAAESVPASTGSRTDH